MKVTQGYRIISTICETRDFIVYRVLTNEDRHVLLKVPVSPSPSAATIQQLEREYELARELDPDFVVRPLCIEREENDVALILEDFACHALTGSLKHPLDLGVFFKIATGITAALTVIHRHGIVHKDIKPENIFLGEDNQDGATQVKLTGFGIASRLSLEYQTTMPLEVMAGTLAYIAPEQTGRMNRSIDSRSDLYSLGITFYQILTGELPFKASDPMQWVHYHIALQPLPPSRRLSSIPEPLSAIVMKLLAKTPEERYQTAEGVKADLEQCLTRWQAHGSIAPFPLGARDIPDRLLIPEKLYGRKREIETLLAAFGRVLKTGAPELVLISGYSGIGKSAVVNELHKALVPSRGLFAEGKFDQYKRDIPYATLAQALQTLVRWILGKNEDEIAHWREAILEAVGPNGQLIANLVPDFALLIGENPPPPKVSPQEDKNRFNIVFRRVVGVFARPEHPLTLFLDDLQWLDTATLQLLEHLLNHPELKHLLLVGAYRDNEVSATHPLMLALDAIRKSGASVRSIAVRPLTKDDVLQLVTDSFHCEGERAEPLAQLVYEKTGGNPFFMIQFLTTLAEEGLVAFDGRTAIWRWDIDHIRGKGFTDNVADLMVAKMNKLPEATREGLKQLAYLGSKAKIATLALLQGITMERVQQNFREAVQAGLVFHQDDSFIFLHDRVQEAAYSLIPEQERAAVHLRIGRRLLSKTRPEELAEKIFDIVNHLNRGAALMTDPAEKERLAHLNADAGRRARASIAYATARNFFAAADALLAEETWDLSYDFKFPLFLDWAECEYLLGAFEKAEALFEVLLAHARSDLDKAVAYELRLKVYQVAGNYDDAVAMGLKALQLFGVDIPRDDEKLNWETQAEAGAVKVNLRGRKIAELADAAEAADPQVKAIIGLLASVAPPAYIGSTPQLFPLIILKQVNYSLRFGHTKDSCVGYSAYGILLVSVFQDPHSGYAFSEMSINLNQRLGDLTLRGSLLHIHATKIHFWLHHIATDFPVLEQGFSACLDAGDLVFANFIAYEMIWQAVERGDALGDVLDFSRKYADFSLGSRNDAIFQTICLEQQFLKCVMGETRGPASFSDEAFSEQSCVEKIAETTFVCGIVYYHVMKLIAAYLMGDDIASRAHSEEAEKALPAAMAMPLEATFYFFHALVLTRTCRERADADREEILKTLTAYQKKLSFWAKYCPANFSSKEALVSAEIAEISGDELSAERLFEQAIESAKANGFIHWAGMANEAAARFYESRGFKTTAQAYLREARYFYDRWGADSKVKQLDNLHPWLVISKMPETATTPERLDALSLARAQQAISGEIQMDRLAQTLLRIVMENAGAQKGYLSVEGGHKLLAVMMHHEGESPQVIFDSSPADEEIPVSLFNYVRNSHETVILSDASTDTEGFSADEYLRREKPKSVLCMAIQRQARLLAVLYLENNLAANVFSAERLELLKALASQSAISMENAGLYETVRQSEQKFRAIFDQTFQFIGMLTVDGIVLQANQTALQFAGVSADAVIGKPFWETPWWSHSVELQQRLRAAIQEAASGKLVRFEAEHAKANGEIRYVDFSLKPITDAEGHVVQLIPEGRDITERKQAEGELRRYKDQLEETVQQRTSELVLARDAAEAANKAKSVFLANMSHELRTPLNAILGFSGIIRKDPLLPDNALANIDIVNRSGEHLLKLINDILEMAKIEAGRVQLEEAPFDLSSMVRNVTEMMQVRATEKGLQLTIDQTSDFPRYIVGDEARLRQILINLVGNALKFTLQGGVTIRLGTKNNTIAHLLIEVEDSGPGIAREDQQRIFEPFNQLDQLAGNKGTGLGLTITRQFVYLMNGTLILESEPGKGSVFRVDLPLKSAEESDITQPYTETAREVIGLAPGQPDYRILVVEDQLENQLLLAKLMESIGFQVRVAENGRQGVDIFQSWHPHLIWMDRRMPVMDGLEATKIIRTLPGGKEVKIVAVTASAFEEQRTETQEVGMDEFISKPYRANEIHECLSRQLGVKYIFSATEPATGTLALSAEMLAAMPKPLLIDLYSALKSLDSDLIAATIQQFEPYDPKLRKTLAQFADNFDYPAILNALKTV